MTAHVAARRFYFPWNRPIWGVCEGGNKKYIWPLNWFSPLTLGAMEALP